MQCDYQYCNMTHFESERLLISQLPTKSATRRPRQTHRRSPATRIFGPTHWVKRVYNFSNSPPSVQMPYTLRCATAVPMLHQNAESRSKAFQQDTFESQNLIPTSYVINAQTTTRAHSFACKRPTPLPPAPEARGTSTPRATHRDNDPARRREAVEAPSQSGQARSAKSTS